ncbi:MAG: hypothetical protein MPJ25_07710, partial [Pirellulales bacterium]|nr:hypothetical protein [Pirellulales bacterium]
GKLTGVSASAGYRGRIYTIFLHLNLTKTNTSVRRLIGQSGQRLGLILPAFAIILELNHTISLGQMLIMLVASICLFGIGRILEGYGQT